MSHYYTHLIQQEIVNPYLANLIAYYPFNANANDFSGVGNNGTVVGTPTYSAGKVGTAINFGTTTNSNYVNIPDSDDFSFTNNTVDLSFSISVWENVTQFSTGFNQILRKRLGSNTINNEYQIDILPNGSFALFKFSNGTSTNYQLIQSAPGVITLNTLNNIIITNRDSNINNVNIYLNGNLITPTRSTIGTYTRMINGTADIQLGNGTTGFKHRGLLDEYYIWKGREMTATEALDIYNKGIAGIPLI